MRMPTNTACLNVTLEGDFLTEKELRISNRECKAIVSNESGTPIMFLHGFSYTNDIWRRIGILSILTEKKIPFIALDMPYGDKSACKPRSSDAEINVNFASEAFKSEFGSDTTPVIVGASLGGYIALRYATQNPVKALMLVSPTRTDKPQLVEAYQNFNFPVRIVWGPKDTIVSQEELHRMASRLPNAKIAIYDGAGHAAYKDKPESFKKELLELYAQVK